MLKPAVSASLVWDGGLRFRATSGTSELLLDGDGAAGASPMQALAFSIAGCMGTDVVDILVKGRHPVRAFAAGCVGTRSAAIPHRYTRIELRFTVHGDVPRAAIERAIALSREKYCSVWHSMRQDIELATAFEVQP